jgi:hypothetical protein
MKIGCNQKASKGGRGVIQRRELLRVLKVLRRISMEPPHNIQYILFYPYFYIAVNSCRITLTTLNSLNIRAAAMMRVSCIARRERARGC